jgi:hypothetical protein
LPPKLFALFFTSLYSPRTFFYADSVFFHEIFCAVVTGFSGGCQYHNFFHSKFSRMLAKFANEADEKKVHQTIWLLIFQMFYYFVAITYIDSSAVQALKDLHQEYKSRDIEVECLFWWKSHLNTSCSFYTETQV